MSGERTEASRRESVTGALAIAIGLIVIAGAGFVPFLLRVRPLEGEAALRDTVRVDALPAGYEVVEARELPAGERMVVLALAGERLREPAPDPAPEQEFGPGRGGGPPRAGTAAGSEEPMDWSEVPLAEAGTLPAELVLVAYPRAMAEDVLGTQFGAQPFGSLEMLGPQGGRLVIERGDLDWGGYRAAWVLERHYHRIDEEPASRDVLRVNLTVAERCAVLYARWPLGAPGSVAPVEEALASLQPLGEG